MLDKDSPPMWALLDKCWAGPAAAQDAVPDVGLGRYGAWE